MSDALTGRVIDSIVSDALTGHVMDSIVSDALTGRVMDSIVSDSLAGPSTRDASTDAADAVRVARASDASMSKIDKTSNKKRKSRSVTVSDVTSRPRVLGSTQAASSGVGQAVDDSSLERCARRRFENGRGFVGNV